MTREAARAFEAFEAKCRAYQGEGFRASRYAICTLDGNRLRKRRISGDLLDAYLAAGFEDGQRTHALRYTAAVCLFELGFHYGDIVEIVGHTTAEMARNYCAKKRRAQLIGRLLDEIDRGNGVG